MITEQESQRIKLEIRVTRSSYCKVMNICFENKNRCGLLYFPQIDGALHFFLTF